MYTKFIFNFSKHDGKLLYTFNMECFMKICYKKLWVLLIQRDITKASFRKDLGLSSTTMSKLNKNEEVSMSILLRICEYLDCDISDICEVVRN